MAAGTGDGDQCDYFNPSHPMLQNTVNRGILRIGWMRQSEMNTRPWSILVVDQPELAPDTECGVCIVLCVTGSVHGW